MGVTPDLTLTGAVEGLLLRGSPVNVDFLGLAVPGVYTARDTRPANQRNGPYLVAPVDCWPEDFNGSSEMIRSCKSEETTLDLTHPLGLATALHYLRERGHDLAWAARWPDVVAWSVLSVARGGHPIIAVGGQWMPQSGVGSKGWIRLCVASRHGDRPPLGTPCRVGSGLILAASASKRKGEDAAALAANYALLNDDSTLTLPSLPEVPNV